jgi:Uma2 family endonuclease
MTGGNQGRAGSYAGTISLQRRRERSAEYWIVDPRQEQITVLKLEGKRYVEHGVFKPGARATSVLLKGFGVAVADVFKAAK